MAEKKKMSVSDILAAARKADAAGGAAEEPSTEPPESVAGSDESSGAAAAPSGGQGSKPAAKPAAGGERPGVADILAKARGEKKKEDPPAGKAAAKKPAAQPAAAKPAAKKAAASGPARDTASILAAARNPQKKGPMSKAEAAARGTTDAPRGKAKLEVPPMPEKPAYAVSKQPAGRRTVDPQRRATVLSLMLSMLVGSGLALGFASLTATLGLWTLGLARFMFPNVLREPPSRFKVGFPSDFVAGQVETKFKAKFGVWLVSWEYNGEAQIYALKSVCTHLGCTPNWLEAEQKFKCPCHGSGFYKDGINFEGPAPRPLERYAIQIADDGQLEIDKSRTFQEEMGQWADPTSYVSV